MYPHERSLVKRLQNQPFALLGINCDGKSLRSIKEATQAAQISWRFWVENPVDPIGQVWQVDGLPTIVLIDAKGIIRFRQPGYVEGEALDRAIDALLAEREKSQPPKS